MKSKSSDKLVTRRRIVLFAHWDPECLIDPYVIHYLGELKKIADITFYSDCDLPQTELAKIESLCVALGAGRHGAYDFGSYRKAYQSVADRLEHYDELILANDSCYGPFMPLRDVFEKMESHNYDYWGLTEYASPSFGDFKHLQSYFVVMKRQVFLHDYFRLFMEGVKVELEKRDVILNYEVGLSQVLEEQGFKRGSLMGFDERNVSYNGDTLRLVAAGTFPFIKREMLACNPCFCPMLSRTMKRYSRHMDREVLEMMLIHLNRFTQGNYTIGWNLIGIPNLILFHKNVFRVKSVITNGKYHSKLFLFGLRTLVVSLHIGRLSHEDVMQRMLGQSADRKSLRTEGGK